MLSNIGNTLIILNILVTLIIIYSSHLSLKNQEVKISKKIYDLSLAQSTISIVTFFVLITGFIVSDFSLITVFQNSHIDKPLFYKISGTWGNHEGSLLLWINVLVLFSYFFLILNKKTLKNYRLSTLIIQNFLIFVFFFKFITNTISICGMFKTFWSFFICIP